MCWCCRRGEAKSDVPVLYYAFDLLYLDGYDWRKVPLEELHGEALFGLVYAASMFDAGRGVPFGAYAYTYPYDDGYYGYDRCAYADPNSWWWRRYCAPYGNYGSDYGW